MGYEKQYRKVRVMVNGKLGIILFIIGILLLGAVLYSTFCWTPGNESRKEEKEEREDG